LTREKIHHIIYLSALAILFGSIPVSNFGMSIGGLLLSLNWVVEWNWQTKWERLRKNKLAILLSSFFFFLFIGLIHTNEWNNAIDNLLSKLPLLYAPLIFSTSKKLNGKEMRFLLFCFIMTTFVSTLISIIYLSTHFIENIRDISLFISHIRFSFCILVSIIFSFQFAIKTKKRPLFLSIFYLFLTCWFIFYLFISQTFTGIILLFVILFVYGLFVVFTERRAYFRKIILPSVSISLVLFIFYLVFISWNYYHVTLPKELPTHTKSGNLYKHNFSSIVENGSYIESFLCEEELRVSWAQRSNTPYDTVAPTLIRYLNSKGLHKDKEGVEELTATDITNIENKIANVAYTEWLGVKRALYPTFFSISLYQHNNTITHSSLLQRIALWKSSCAIIANHLFLGVGIGDHKVELNKQLTKENSELRKDMGAHNQFLTFTLMGGLCLLFGFLLILFLPFFMTSKARTINYILFFIIIFSSFFFEDTLETQAGITFYAILNSFLLFSFDLQKIIDNPFTKRDTDNNKGKNKLILQ
jgi:hypothetical protein